MTCLLKNSLAVERGVALFKMASVKKVERVAKKWLLAILNQATLFTARLFLSRYHFFFEFN